MSTHTAPDGPITHFDTIDDLIAFLERTQSLPMEEPGLCELDHGLQCAEELRLCEPDDIELQIAGLVHDVCHGQCHIAVHDKVGGEAVRKVLGDRIADLVSLHVDAKRYLVATDETYRAQLSRVSIRTMELQGGAMTTEDAAIFGAGPNAADAVKLRRADEAAKQPGRIVPDLDAWREPLRRVSARYAGA